MPGPSFLIVRGVISMIIGVVAFVWPGVTIAVLVGLFALYAFVDGATNLVLGLSAAPRYGRSWMLALEGIAGLAIGVMTFLWPGVTALALIWFIAAWAVLTGVLEIVAAIRLRRVIVGEWLLLLSGVLSLAYGVLIAAFPGAGAIGIAWVLGAYAVATGVILVLLGIRLRSHLLAVV